MEQALDQTLLINNDQTFFGRYINTDVQRLSKYFKGMNGKEKDSAFGVRASSVLKLCARAGHKLLGMIE